MNGAVIAAEGLSKWFGEVVALNNVDLRIGPGVTGLLGPNGAGKSTFIKLTLGLHDPSQGALTVFGERPRNNPRVLRRIGYCPESEKFHDAMSGFEYVYWLCRFWGMRGRDARTAAESAIEQVRMTSRMHDPIAIYSKGMRQRIKIAQAIAASPELLFLDEPMSGLDPEGREEMYALIRALGAAGVPVVVSSHILYEIERTTDNVILLFKGAVLASGQVREIRALIDDHPHTITIETPSPRALAAHFLEDAAITGMELEAGRLVLRTRDPSASYDRLNRLGQDPALPILAVACADDNLQSVFDYLVR